MKVCEAHNRIATHYVHWIGSNHWSFVCDECFDIHKDHVWTDHSIEWGINRVESIQMKNKRERGPEYKTLQEFFAG